MFVYLSFKAANAAAPTAAAANRAAVKFVPAPPPPPSRLLPPPPLLSAFDVSTVVDEIRAKIHIPNIYRVFRKNCVFFTIHCNPSLAYIAVRDLQSSQRNVSVQSLILVGKLREIPGKNTIFNEHPVHTHRHIFFLNE